MKVLIVKPEKRPYEAEIDGSLESMQAIVDGHIEAVYPFEDPVALVCNEEAKIQLLPPNRALGNVSVLLWATLWAIWEGLMAKGWPRRWNRSLTPNFIAVRDLAGCWRIFQRPAPAGSCKEILKELLADQRRLPEALEPGMYRTLTHDTILNRLRQMDNVEILSCKPAYVATLEATLSGAVRGRCSHCSGRCPFLGRRQLRQFYDVCFLVPGMGTDGIYYRFVSIENQMMGRAEPKKDPEL